MSARDRRGARRNALVLTCEHGGNTVPSRWRRGFTADAQVLDSHRGYDRGALGLARRLARSHAVPLHAATVTRLLVDLNRAATNPRVFSEFSRDLAPARRAQLISELHAPHRQGVRAAIAQRIGGGERAVHVAVHSFTPVLDGVVRTADIGLLYDPARRGERAFAAALRDALGRRCPQLRVRMNYPYRGVSDGLTRWLRTCFSDRDYVGLELELNAGLVDRHAAWRAVCAAVDGALGEVIAATWP